MSSFNKQDVTSKHLESDTHAPDLPLQDHPGEDTNPATTGTTRQKGIPPFLSIPPPVNALYKYFAVRNYPEVEATRFFNHYQANGFKQGGNRPI